MRALTKGAVKVLDVVIGVAMVVAGLGYAFIAPHDAADLMVPSLVFASMGAFLAIAGLLDWRTRVKVPRRLPFFAARLGGAFSAGGAIFLFKDTATGWEGDLFGVILLATGALLIYLSFAQGWVDEK